MPPSERRGRGRACGGSTVRSAAAPRTAWLPEKAGAAAAEFITGPLPDNPRRVGHRLRGEYARTTRVNDLATSPCLPDTAPVRAGDTQVRRPSGGQVIKWFSQRKRFTETSAALASFRHT
jgi:hypothetical protein